MNQPSWAYELARDSPESLWFWSSVYAISQCPVWKPQSADQGSGPSVADFKIKAAIFPLHSCCCLSQQRCGPPHPADVPGPFSAWNLGRHLPRSARSLPTACDTLDELEALGLVVGQARLEQHGVHPELSVQQGHVAIHLDKEVDAFVPLVEVGVIV